MKTVGPNTTTKTATDVLATRYNVMEAVLLVLLAASKAQSAGTKIPLVRSPVPRPIFVLRPPLTMRAASALRRLPVSFTTATPRARVTRLSSGACFVARREFTILLRIFGRGRSSRDLQFSLVMRVPCLYTLGSCCRAHLALRARLALDGRPRVQICRPQARMPTCSTRTTATVVK